MFARVEAARELAAAKRKLATVETRTLESLADSSSLLAAQLARPRRRYSARRRALACADATALAIAEERPARGGWARDPDGNRIELCTKSGFGVLV